MQPPHAEYDDALPNYAERVGAVGWIAYPWRVNGPPFRPAASGPYVFSPVRARGRPGPARSQAKTGKRTANRPGGGTSMSRRRVPVTKAAPAVKPSMHQLLGAVLVAASSAPAPGPQDAKDKLRYLGQVGNKVSMVGDTVQIRRKCLSAFRPRASSPNLREGAAPLVNANVVLADGKTTVLGLLASAGLDLCARELTAYRGNEGDRNYWLLYGARCSALVPGRISARLSGSAAEQGGWASCGTLAARSGHLQLAAYLFRAASHECARKWPWFERVWLDLLIGLSGRDTKGGKSRPFLPSDAINVIMDYCASCPRRRGGPARVQAPSALPPLLCADDADARLSLLGF